MLFFPLERVVPGEERTRYFDLLLSLSVSVVIHWSSSSGLVECVSCKHTIVGLKHESQENKTDLCILLRRPWQFSVIAVITDLDVVIVKRIKSEREIR